MEPESSGILISTCCVCRRHYGVKSAMGGNGGESHGFCEPCGALMLVRFFGVGFIPFWMCDDYLLTIEDMDMDVIEQVVDEVGRAMRKFPTWPSDPLHALAILGEEFGELNKAMLQLTYEPNKTSANEVRTEAIQTAAMALRLIWSLDHYEYRACEQHVQA
jgi:hypothetical protein